MSKQTLIDALTKEYKEAEELLEDCIENNESEAVRYAVLNLKNAYKMTISLVNEHLADNGWISVDDMLPTQSDQYWIAYHPISNYNPNEKTKEICYCTAHFNEYEKVWSVKDQLFYTQRRCKVLFWQPLPQLPKE